MGPNRTRDNVEATLPLVALLIVFFLAFRTLEPFLPAIVWGVILAISLRPVHDGIARRLVSGRALATTIVSVLMVCLLLLPMLGLSRAMLAFIPDALEWLSSAGGALDLVPPDAPDGGEPVTQTSLWETLVADVRYVASHFSEEIRPAAFWLIGEAQLVGTFVAEFAIGVLLAAILLHRAEPIGRTFISLVHRVAGPFAKELAERSVVTIRASVFGLLGSAFVQTALASLAYWVIDAPHWPILSLLTFMLAMIQIGPVLIWAPLAIWLWADGAIALSIGLVAWGLFVVGLSDNFIKTLTVSRGADLPAILAFLGAVGGLFAWGIVGLFLGPVVVAVCHQIVLRWVFEEKDTPDARVGD